MPSITDVINAKYNVEGINIADALCKAGKVATPTDNIADAVAAFNSSAESDTTTTTDPVDPEEP